MLSIYEKNYTLNLHMIRVFFFSLKNDFRKSDR